MTSVYQMQNSAVISKLEDIIRNQAKGSNGEFLKKINEIISWKNIFIVVMNQSLELSGTKYERTDILCLIKCLIIGKIFNITDGHLPFEIADRNSFQIFIGIKSPGDIPDSEIISSFKNILMYSGAYDEMFDLFYEQLLESKFHIVGDTDETQYNKNDFSEYQDDFSKEDTFDNKINEIENRIKMLYEKKLPLTLRGIDKDKSHRLKEKLINVKEQVEKLSNDKKESESKDFGRLQNNIQENAEGEVPSQIYQRLMNIEKRVNNIQDIASLTEVSSAEKEKKEPYEKNGKKEDELYKEIFDSFYKSLEDKGIVKKPVIPVSADESFKSLKETATEDLKQVEQEYTEQKPLSEKEPELIEEKEKLLDEEIQKPGIKIHDPFVIMPKAKREGIFNDANLTEDYELGYRFFKLGFKTGFFNLKLDKTDEATRIATAEFFPNTFWAAVKQRSRWIAGICFQNWKAHKWAGNLVTKYFLFRDRKSLFSFFGAFLSNVIFLYLLYSIICNIFHIKYVFSLVGHSSVLWYLMIANLVFMISRASHRFIFTYNWYGFKYAFFSFFRLLLDTFVNFFAILRSFSVYKKTKKKVVWDSTSHY